MCVSVSSEMYLCIPHACNALGDQRRASDPLELELPLCDARWMLGTESQSSAGAISALTYGKF